MGVVLGKLELIQCDGDWGAGVVTIRWQRGRLVPVRGWSGLGVTGVGQGAAGPVWGGREGLGYWGERGLYWGTTLTRMGVRGGAVPAGQVLGDWGQSRDVSCGIGVQGDRVTPRRGQAGWAPCVGL